MRFVGWHGCSKVSILAIGPNMPSSASFQGASLAASMRQKSETVQHEPVSYHAFRQKQILGVPAIGANWLADKPQEGFNL